jgi:WD40 repeat protein/energy-coupling factor transporter ATP-binding protein EcfA2
MTPLAAADAAMPFPGLRSYRITEADWFFGREGKSDAMAKKLARGRFLAVVGESGCGKSSLVRAGLLSTLEAGLLTNAGSRWKIVDMQPGGDPIGRLSAALIESGYTEGSSREALERDPGALAKVYAGNKGFSGSLLLLVDQFEELFRYSAHRDEKAGFVQLILEAARQPSAPIYVVLTMRSDFLGECAQFRGLPEEINEGQYLVPRMTRENLRDAIEGPIRLAGAEIEPRLTQVLLDEVGSEPDQLPVLQHALMRTWNNWVARRKPDDPVREKPDYAKTGRLQNALSEHADEALCDAAKVLGGTVKAEALAAVVFPLLWDRDANGRDVRRPEELGQMRRVSGANSSDISALLKEFRIPGRTFITASREEEEGRNSDDIEFDVTHESFLRKWKRLRDKWIPDEVNSRRIYLRLVQHALDCDPKNPSYMDGTVLEQTLEWAEPPESSEKRKPTAEWAKRYASFFPNEPADGLFQKAMAFLVASRAERDARRNIEAKATLAIKRTRLAYLIIGLVVFGLVVVGSLAVGLWQERKHATALAQHATVLAMVSRALLASQSPEQLERSLLLAAESQRIEPTVEAQALLSRSLDLLPKPLPDLSQPGARFVSYNADGTRLAASNRDGQITVWDTATGQVANALSGGLKLRGLWWLKDRLLVLRRDALPRILGLDGKTVELTGCNADALAVSPDAKLVVEHCPGKKSDELLLWSVDSEIPKLSSKIHMKSVDTDSEEVYLALSNSDSQSSKGVSWIAIVTQDKYFDTEDTITFYSAKLRKFVGPSRLDTHLTALDFNSDNSNLAGLGANGRAYHWSLSSKDVQLDGSARPLDARTFDFSKAKGRIFRDYIIAGTPGKAVGVWDTHGRQLAMASGSAAISALCVSGREFCALGRDGAIRRWKIPETKTSILSLLGTFSPDGKWLITRSASRWYLRQGTTGAPKDSGSTRDFFPRAFDPSGMYVLGALPDHNYEVRAFIDGKIDREKIGGIRLGIEGPMYLSTTPKFSADGKKLLSFYSQRPMLQGLLTGDNVERVMTHVLQVWDWKSGQMLGIQHPDSNVLTFFGPDNDTVFMDAKDQLSAWHVSRNVVEPASVKTEGMRTVWAALPDKGLAACGVTARQATPGDADQDEDSDAGDGGPSTGNQVIVWKYPSWEEQVRLEHPERVRLVHFNRDGSQLLSVTTDGTVRLWDWKARKLLAIIPAVSSVVAAEITGDTQIAVLDRNNFTTYDWQPEKLREQVCQHVRYNLTKEEWAGFQLEGADYPQRKLCPNRP